MSLTFSLLFAFLAFITMFHWFMGHVAVWVSRLFFWLFAKVEVEGLENVPQEGPLIVVANHFSYYEVPLIGVTLPFVPRFFAAAELTEGLFLRLALWINNSILVKRGHADREALEEAFEELRNGGILAIFPEGGITEETVAVASQGQSTNQLVGQHSRVDGKLIPARAGAAFIASRTAVPILPIAIIGTEKLEGNLSLWRKIKVKVRIGRPFGPLVLDPTLRGRAKREQMDKLGHEMMRQVAALMPTENRGYYG